MAFVLLVHDVVERPHLLDAFVAGSPRAQPRSAMEQAAGSLAWPMRRVGGRWREPLILEDEHELDHRVLQCGPLLHCSSAQKIAISTRETHRAKRARRPRARLPHLAVSTTRATGRWTRQIHAESTVYTSSTCSTAPSILMICLMSRLSPAGRRVPSRAATNCGRTAISSVLATLISMPSPPAVRSQPLLANLAAAGRAPTARRWASHVAPLSAARRCVLCYLRRRVRYSVRYTCASSGEADRAQPSPRTRSRPPAARQHLPTFTHLHLPSRRRSAFDSALRVRAVRNSQGAT